MRDAATIWHRMPLTLVLCAALGPATAAYAAGIDNQSFDQVERGRYLSIVGDCAACHTLPGSGHALAGGRVLETPFGSLLSPNITPDDALAIRAYLNTLPPVHNEVRPDQLPFPLNVRENMVAWDRLFFR